MKSTLHYVKSLIAALILLNSVACGLSSLDLKSTDKESAPAEQQESGTEEKLFEELGTEVGNPVGVPKKYAKYFGTEMLNEVGSSNPDYPTLIQDWKAYPSPSKLTTMLLVQTTLDLPEPYNQVLNQDPFKYLGAILRPGDDVNSATPYTGQVDVYDLIEYGSSEQPSTLDQSANAFCASIAQAYPGYALHASGLAVVTYSRELISNELKLDPSVLGFDELDMTYAHCIYKQGPDYVYGFVSPHITVDTTTAAVGFDYVTKSQAALVRFRTYGTDLEQTKAQAEFFELLDYVGLVY
jgi:hypothetical protein